MCQVNSNTKKIAFLDALTKVNSGVILPKLSLINLAFLLCWQLEHSSLIYLYGRKISVYFRCHMMTLCSSSQWKIVYWLVLCCNKIGWCILSYGWSCLQNISFQLLAFWCRVLWKEIFIEVGENPFCSVNLLFPDGLHSNEDCEFTAGT